VEGAGQAKDVTLKVTETDDTIVVEFNLAQPTIDAAETVKGLIAPALPSQGKGVCVTGRGPVALAAALAEAYAHKVPYIANFVPGTGYVVSISHDAKFPLGTVIPAKK
jgi:CRISPR-associated Csx3 family protein